MCDNAKLFVTCDDGGSHDFDNDKEDLSQQQQTMFMRKMRSEVKMHKKETKAQKIITFLLEELFHGWMDNNADVQKFLQLLMMMAYIALRQRVGTLDICLTTADDNGIHCIEAKRGKHKIL